MGCIFGGNLDWWLEIVVCFGVLIEENVFNTLCAILIERV